MRERWLTALLLALLALVWLPEGLLGFAPLLQHFDHCEGYGCDFLTYYLPQGHALAERRILPGWTSPPLLALLFGLDWSLNAWMAVNLAGTLILAGLCAMEVGWLGPVLVGLSMPVIHALKWGQPSVILALLGIIGAYLPATRGWLVGTAGGLKVYPLAWLWDSVIRKEGAPLLRAAGMAVLTGVGIPLVLIGERGTVAYWKNLWRFQKYADSAIASASELGGQGLPVVLLRLGWPPLAGWLLPLLAIPLFRRLEPVPAAALAMTVTLLPMHPGWHHYYCFLPWVQAVAWKRGERLCTMGSILLSAVVLVLLPEVDGIYEGFTAMQGTAVSALLAAAALARTKTP